MVNYYELLREITEDFRKVSNDHTLYVFPRNEAIFASLKPKSMDGFVKNELK